MSLFSIDELTSRQSQCFQKLDRNNDGHVEKTKFNIRFVVICKLIDGNRDDKLDGENILMLKNRSHSRKIYRKNQGGKRNNNSSPGPVSFGTSHFFMRRQ